MTTESEWHTCAERGCPRLKAVDRMIALFMMEAAA